MMSIQIEKNTFRGGMGIEVELNRISLLPGVFELSEPIIIPFVGDVRVHGIRYTHPEYLPHARWQRILYWLMNKVDGWPRK